MENFDGDIQKAMDKATLEAMNEEDFNKKKEMQNDLARAYIEGHINGDEYEALYDTEGNIEKGITEFNTPEEFKKALELLGLDQETVDELFNHELGHYNIDIKNGLKPRFILQFFHLINGQIGIVPAVKTTHTEDDEKIRQKAKESISAPHDLSDSDKKMLGLE